MVATSQPPMRLATVLMYAVAAQADLVRQYAAGAPAKLAVLVEPKYVEANCAAMLAMRHVERRNGTVISELANLPANFSLDARLSAVDHKAHGAVEDYREAVGSWMADAIVGTPRSLTAYPLAYLSSTDGIPMLFRPL